MMLFFKYNNFGEFVKGEALTKEQTLELLNGFYGYNVLEEFNKTRTADNYEAIDTTDLIYGINTILEKTDLYFIIKYYEKTTKI